MKRAIIFLVCLFFFSFLQAKDVKIVPLPELMKPGMMYVSGDRVFITENATASIYIYSLKDYRLIKKFGKAGEGPKEFKISNFSVGLIVFPFMNHLVVNSDDRISYFTREGGFVKEIKKIPFSVIYPIKDGFVGSATAVSEKNKPVLAIHLFNSKLEKGKELYRSDVEFGPGANFNMPINTFYFIPYKERIYLAAGKEGFVIDVFDTNANKLYRIKKDYTPLKVPNSYKERTEHWFKHESPFKDFVGTIFHVTFKDYFPAMKDIIVDSDKIYVLTYKKQKGKNEWVILDLKGKELNRVFMPIPEELPLFALIAYDIQDNIFYSLEENIVEEVWELHMQAIEN
ncbi:MAG: hypothetical protein JSV88_28535 [Candidatus Aminicenantes bacterium]|nr:MAG: hypothetical protein JSV88_28535 [Candidatus Aminicenantes bacterium]